MPRTRRGLVLFVAGALLSLAGLAVTRRDLVTALRRYVENLPWPDPTRRRRTRTVIDVTENHTVDLNAARS
jgi:hypothetical protein